MYHTETQKPVWKYDRTIIGPDGAGTWRIDGVLETPDEKAIRVKALAEKIAKESAEHTARQKKYN